jgi:K+-transporting ATPase ATPase C chain
VSNDTKLRPTQGSTDAVTHLRAALLLIVLCGGVYPTVTTLVGGALFPHQSTGSIIEVDGRKIGSELVGQPFASKRYFYGRPSAAGYDPFSMTGSNLAPSNPDLRARVRARAKMMAKLEDVPVAQIPIDLLAASGSGIDPHISPAAAAIQIERVAQARSLPEQQARRVIDDHTESSILGILGQPRVNVLRLNLALDEMAGRPAEQ